MPKFKTRHNTNFGYGRQLHFAGRNALRTRIMEGLYPPPINLGARAVGWLSYETEAVIAATASGQSDDKIREIVQHLINRRRQLGDFYHDQ